MKIIVCLISLFLGIQVYSFAQESQKLTAPIINSCISTTIIQTKLKLTSEGNTNSVAVIPPKEEILLLDYIGESNWKVSYNSKVGYLNELLIKQTSEMELIKKAYYKNQAKHASQEEITFDKIRINELNKKFGSYYASYIMKGKISMGMSKEMVEEAKGKPDEIKTGETDWGFVDLWIYSDKDLFIYFENAKVSTFNK